MREYLSTIRDNSHLGRLHSGDRCCMWRKLEQVWYLKLISTGIMNMVMELARQREGDACRCNSHGGHCKWGVHPCYAAVSSDSGKNGTARVHLQSITPPPHTPTDLRDETPRGRGEARLFRCGNFSGMTTLINEQGFKLSIRPMIA